MSRDKHILTGISSIVNPANVGQRHNLQDIERKMINSGVITQSEAVTHPEDILSGGLESISDKLGLNYEGVRKKRTEAMYDTSSQSSYQPSYQSSHTASYQSSYPTSHATSQSSPYSSYTSSYADVYAPRNYNDKPDPATSTNASTDASADNEPDGLSFPSSTDSESVSLWPEPSSVRTKEQEKRQQINQVIGPVSDEFGFDLERQEDARSEMIAEIDELMVLLASEINVSNIPTITDETSFDQIDRILRLLRRKNDTVRYCSLAEEMIMFGATTLEELFNGKRVWLGYYRPNLEGWHNHVSVKLKRMRYDTRSVVSDIMRGMHISPLLRIAIELIPNMFLYSKMKSQQTSLSSRMDNNMMLSTRQLDEL